jgi:Uma2 family endonuclease
MTPPATIPAKYPISLAERAALGPEVQRFPGTLTDFAELLDQCEYPIEFQIDQIIAMSIASDPHEQIVANVLYVLGTLYTGNPEFKRYGSNRHVFIEQGPVAFSPDASVVRGTPDVFEYASGKTANRNPWLIVEILSPSTRWRDWGEKLEFYKQIPALQHVLYIEQDKPSVNHFQRLPADNRWSSMEYNALDQGFELDGQTVGLKELYENVL